MKKIILSLILLAIPAVVLADSPPTFGESMGRFNTFMNNTSVLLNNILADGDLRNLVEITWTTFAICLIVIAGGKYILSDLSQFDLIHTLLMVAVTRLLLDNYDYLTSLGWDMSEGIAGGIQQAAIGNSDPFLLPAFINDVMDGIEHNDVSWWSAFWTFLAANVVFAIVSLFSILGFIIHVWALWGFALSKIIGFFFIPFLMLKRTSFLFDGWMRLFTGFLVYAVIARINLLLTVLAIKSLFGIPGYAINTSYNVQWDFNGLADIIGLVGFLIVGILALISTGRFAAAVSSGATGFGSSVSSAAYSLARIVRGGI
ncbi:MAG: hypothetical protein VR64_14515 [Desulfatitalea sp. BRH_c12]|nr:MAG: hypothetical protein VR64_14515 [Desulfatitalea sp. BRH_c12]